MVEPISEQGHPCAGHQPEQQAPHQAARQIRLHRATAKAGWADHLPGQGFLGYLQPEGFPRLEVAGEVFPRHLQPLIERVVALHELRAHDAKGPIELADLPAHLGLLGGIFAECRGYRIQLAGLQQRPQPVALSCELLQKRRAAAVGATGLRQPALHVREIR